jgi:periplasmic protein CpxP/Spy
MNKNRFYQISIAALFFLNTVLLFLHFNRPQKPMGPKEIITEKLHFDKIQITKYESLILEHQQLINTNEAEINKVKNELYQQLNNSAESLKLDSLSKNIATLQQKAEMINFRHFQDIKKICKPEQMPLFKKLVGELSSLFQNKKPNKKK